VKPEQARLAAVLERLKIDRVSFLNRGMTAEIYDIGDGRVLKIHNGPLEQDYLPSLSRFCHRLQRHSLPFAVPLIHGHGAVAGIHYHIERRLPGQNLAGLFPRLTAAERQMSLNSLLEALPPLHTVHWPDLPYGELLCGPKGITALTWPDFLLKRVSATLARSRPDLQHDLPESDRIVDNCLAQLASLPDLSSKRLVHGDFFLGNVLCDEKGTLTAIVDFSSLTLIGDPLVDVAGAYYFCRIYDFVNAADYRVLRQLIDRRYGPECWRRIDLYHTFYSLRFSDCKRQDNHTYRWCLRRLREL